MEKSELFRKLFYKQWVIGFAKADIKEVIRKKAFPDEITWMPPDSPEHFMADPFILSAEDNSVSLLYEDFSIEENYGNLSLMKLDGNLKPLSRKVLLDTRSHLSFPFIFRENGGTFIIPESVRSGKVSCYEYDEVTQNLEYKADMVDMPLYDPAILKMGGKYWLFGSEFRERSDYLLHIFISNSLTGPYKAHPRNPVMRGLDGTRAAGNFIEVDGTIYRPAQNCGKRYGDSMTIKKIMVLDESRYSEEPYMTIEVSEKDLRINNIHTIHTLNYSDNLISVDGMMWTFSMKEQWRNFLRNRRLVRAGKVTAG